VRRIRPLVSALLALTAILGHLDAAVAAPPPPTDLHPAEGEGWRPVSDFTLFWHDGAGDVAAVHYLVEDPLGSVVIGPQRIDWAAQRVALALPHGQPGAYTAKVWLEDTAGAQGPPAAVRLRYDSVRPGGSEPMAEAGWIGRAELPHAFRVSHPEGPYPVSGIRGYAISIDRNPEGRPCASPARGAAPATALWGGGAHDALLVDEPPEGVSYVHAVAVSGSGMRSPVPGHATIRIDKTDPATRLEGLPDGWTSGPVRLRAVATDSASGMSPAPGGAPFTAIQVDGGAPVLAAGDSVEATVIASGIHTVAYYARDAAGNVDDGRTANGRPDAASRTATLRIDRDPPAVAFIGSADPLEPELIEARVSDPLSGPDPSRGEIAVRAAGGGDPFLPLPTAVDGETLRARWDSDAYPSGDYEFRATGRDAAGNATSTTRRLNGSAMVLPSPLKARALLETRLAREGGAGASVVGKLVATSDSPLAGEPVRVIELFDRGAAIGARTTVVTTGEDGGFGLRLAPGPSREVVATFAGTPSATGAASGPLRLGVRSTVRMRASARVAEVGGRPLVFRGAVDCPSAEAPDGGISVELQFRAPGLGWSEFRTVHTNRRGRFRYPYRFSDDDSRGVRFRFRAFVPTQSDWPYEPGGSRPVAVRGA
jgi:hypothetical protein